MIAEFEAKHASRTLDIAHRLESNLQSLLLDSGLTDVDVRIMSQTITNEEEAQTIANESESKAVIWGWYDDVGIQVRIFLSGMDQPGKEIPGTNEIPLELSGNDDTQLMITIRDVLPQNVSFLSLFVIGNLHYQANEYQAGYDAFDVAMRSIPENVAIENEAILHFFQARLMKSNDPEDLTPIICEYSKAIELDPNFAEAYNNLGVLFSKLIEITNSGFRIGPYDKITNEAIACLENAGFNEFSVWPDYLFDIAHELQPNWTILKFNKLAYQWNQWDIFGNDHPLDMVNKLEEIIREDKSIMGAYPILANIELYENENPEAAIYWLIAGVEESPKDVHLHVNLGQLYLLLEDLENAESEFLTALSFDPENPEAHLAIANLYLKEDLEDEAMEHIEAVLASEDEEYFNYFYRSPIYDALLLKSKILVSQGNPLQAIEYLESMENSLDIFISCYEYYLLGLLHELTGEDSVSTQYFNTVNYCNTYVPDKSAVTYRAFAQMRLECDNWAEDTWLSHSCMSTNLTDRILDTFEYFQANLHYRLYYYRWFIVLDLACPYVYTYNQESMGWTFDTTILYKQKGLENNKIQKRPLANFDGRILLWEVEHEISYIDKLYVLVESEDGKQIKLYPQLNVLHNSDGQYLELNSGDEILLNFVGFENIKDPVRYWIVAEGFYISLDDSILP